MYPKSIQKLVELFARFPTVGRRSAARFVFYLIKASDEEVDELVAAIQALKKEIHLCEFCFNPYEAAEDTSRCSICQDSRRKQSLLCIVEKESDLEALEKTKSYEGLYFILGDAVNAMRKDDIKNIRRDELRERVESGGFEEVIIATNPTTEGEATALYIERMLSNLGVKATRLGRGLPVGGELEYTDEETLRSALEGRK
jgi:recombination protein RecR